MTNKGRKLERYDGLNGSNCQDHCRVLFTQYNSSRVYVLMKMTWFPDISFSVND